MDPGVDLVDLPVVVLIGINVVLALFGSPMRISIIGSIILTLMVGGIMGATSRRR